MAVTQAQVDALKEALANNRLEIEFEGRRLKYRSVDEIIKAIGFLETELEKASPTATPGRVYAGFSRE